MYTDDLSLEASAASTVEGDRLVVSSAKIPHLASEMQRKGFTRVSLHTWSRPVDYRPDPNAYEEN